jgi:hypothetical protein
MLSTRDRLLAAAALALAALVATVSSGGLVIADLYARETPNWRAQTIGQDWFDLVVLVPVLLACAAGVLRRSRRALLLLGGALAFTVYTFLLYAFAVHFNRMFFAYCGILGISSFALAVLAARLAEAPVARWIAEPPPIRAAGAFLAGTAAVFLLLWLAEDVPAVLRGTPPASHAEVGLPTNPVHVIDLSLVLPLMLIAGIAALRRTRLGHLLAPILLAFSTLMSASIATLMLVMAAHDQPAPLPVAAAMAALTLAGGAILVRLLARKPQHEPGAATGRGVEPHLAAMAQHRREHVREAEAGA